ncbi:MAG: M24 family metallopeptidase [Caldilineaceae bacterium]
MPLRVIKDEAEIAIMRKAGAITEAAYQATLSNLRHGMNNLDLISEVQYQLKKHGAQTDSFVTSFYNMGPNYPFACNREEMLLVPLEPRSLSHMIWAASMKATAMILAARSTLVSRTPNIAMSMHWSWVRKQECGTQGG